MKIPQRLLCLRKISIISVFKDILSLHFSSSHQTEAKTDKKNHCLDVQAITRKLH